MKKTESLPSATPLEEREAAYLAARERIFSLDGNDEKKVTAPKSRKVPVVAQRMIAHALGAKISISASDQKLVHNTISEDNSEEHVPSCSEYSKKTTVNLHWHKKKIREKPANESSMSTDTNTPLSSSKSNSVPKWKNGEKEQIGAAKRIFANALGLTSGRVKQASPVKANQGSTCEQDI